jgi:hypothetical protein
MAVDLSTYGGSQRPLGYAGDLVDENNADVMSMANMGSVAVLPGTAVASFGSGASAGKGAACKAPVADGDKLVGIAKRFPIRPAAFQTDVVSFAQYDEVPVIRMGDVYVTPVENVTDGQAVVSIAAQNGALGSAENNPNPAGGVVVSLPGTAAATGSITIGTNPADGDTVTIHGTAVTFKNTLTTGIQCQIGIDAATTATSLAALLTANVTSDANIAKSTYTNPSSGVVLVTSVVHSTASNALTLATSVSGKITVPATLSGGKGNVGNGVLTPDVTTPVLSDAKAGKYEVVCIAAASNSGTFRVYDPNGDEVGSDVAVAATFATQIKFVVADGSSDFVVGDQINVTVQPASNSGRIALPGATWKTTTASGQLGIVRIIS